MLVGLLTISLLIAVCFCPPSPSFVFPRLLSLLTLPASLPPSAPPPHLSRSVSLSVYICLSLFFLHLCFAVSLCARLVCGCAVYGLTHCNTLQHCNILQHTATHYNTLQHTATHCNTLQHTATHCNTLQHTCSPCTIQPSSSFFLPRHHPSSCAFCSLPTPFAV